MKTEQELKDALEDIFFDALNDKSNYTSKVDPENDGYWQCKVYELCADAVINAGYGDVSEYKTEIERLREMLGQCNTELNSALETLKSQCREIGKLKAEVKQAQVDVLNELKARSIGCSFLGEKLITESEIDELIEEVQGEWTNLRL